MTATKPLLSVKDLVVRYQTENGTIKALNGVDLQLREGCNLGLVGETGAGKTTLAKSIMRLLRAPSAQVVSGQIFFRDENLLDLSPTQMRAIRGKQISMIFQDPMTSLNPVLTVGEQIAEVVANHNKVTGQEAMSKAREMLELVEIPAGRVGEYPHQFSGGMKQRVVIAIALACTPRLLIADEPTTALDVTIQAQVLDLMRDLKKRLGTSTLMITHDIGVVAQSCDYVSIIYAGEIVESGTIREVFKDTRHPYTQGLFGSIPDMNTRVRRLSPVEGLMPDPAALPEGCVFHPRCKHAQDICRRQKPGMTAVAGEHTARCFLVEGTISEKAEKE